LATRLKVVDVTSGLLRTPCAERITTDTEQVGLR
jgi:hypothetical protein